MAVRRTLTREYLEALLVAMVFAVFARTWAVQAFKIPTGSMEQNLLIGDHILVNKFAYGPTLWMGERVLLPLREIRRGDIAVFKFPDDPSRDFIKRCIGLPGDRIEIRAKQTYVNGGRVEDSGYTFFTDPHTYPENPLLHESFSRRDHFGPYVVPEGHYFFLGDNRDNSNDSRFWGTVPAEYVKGRAFMIYWSFAGDEAVAEWAGIQGKLQQLGQVAGHFLDRTRWQRSFRLVR
jgi:signal peptidase I